MMIDISKLSLKDKEEIAKYIREDTLEYVNKIVQPVVPRQSLYTKFGKRCFDILIGSVGFVISSPINLVLAIITFFDVGRPIIFKQQRMGLGEKEFTIYKFRNMTNDVDANGELLPASQRITKWGRFARKTSLDELLNFISIIKGDMSVIGPRPLLDRYADRLNIRHKSIYLVKPGLECPPINHLAKQNSFQDRLENYVWYVENCSFIVDIKLCFRVLLIAFDRRSSAERSNASHGGVLGYDKTGNLIGIKCVPKQYIDMFCENHGYSGIEEAIEARNVTSEG